MKIALFGGGPACLLAACQLSEKHEVHIYEKGKRLGRKFLVAGNGGFNLTNEADGEDLIAVYSNDPTLQQALLDFGSAETRKWLAEIGVQTYVGSSGRVFPKKGIKPTDVLQKIIQYLENNGVKIHLNHSFIRFSERKNPVVIADDTELEIEADHAVFGLGGGSWSKTGSNNKWLACFNEIGVKTIPFQASNCGLNVDWSADFKEKYAGTPLKNISIEVDGQRCKGEALLTEYGIEGNAIYPLVPSIRKGLSKKEKATIIIDFKPNSTIEMLCAKLSKSAVKPKNYQHIFNIDKATLQLVKLALSKTEYLTPMDFAKGLKRTQVSIQGLRPINEAISTVGGIMMSEIDADFRLNKYPHISIIGEMLDWDAPTGGFLLQACFSTGVRASKILK